MQTYTTNQAKTHLGEFLDLAQREPVPVMRHGPVVGAMVSTQDCEAMRAFYADRLQRTPDDAAAGAVAANLTSQALAALLADAG